MSDLVAWLTQILDEDEKEAGYDKYRDDSWWMEGPFDADNVLADIAAKRAILALHSGDDDWPCQSAAGNWVYEPCPTLRLLASIYADRSGYDESWKP